MSGRDANSTKLTLITPSVAGIGVGKRIVGRLGDRRRREQQCGRNQAGNEHGDTSRSAGYESDSRLTLPQLKGTIMDSDPSWIW